MEKKNINLLQERGAPATFWERLYDWMTNTCRIIVILTEFLVLGAFGWRFWLDRTLNDLKDDIETKGEILKSLASQEDEIRLLQSKINTYKDLWVKSSNFSPTLKEINDYIPSDTEELSVSIVNSKEGKGFVISGEVERDQISKLENKLKDSESFSDVTLSAIEKKQEGIDLHSFTLTAKIIFNQTRQPLGQNENTESAT